MQQFNRTYGTEADSLRAWQALAHVVGLAPIPETLEACRAVRARFVSCEFGVADGFAVARGRVRRRSQTFM